MIKDVGGRPLRYPWKTTEVGCSFMATGVSRKTVNKAWRVWNLRHKTAMKWTFTQTLIGVRVKREA